MLSLLFPQAEKADQGHYPANLILNAFSNLPNSFCLPARQVALLTGFVWAILTHRFWGTALVSEIRNGSKSGELCFTYA